MQVKRVESGTARSWWVAWKPPDVGWLKLSSDGAYKRHDGVANNAGAWAASRCERRLGDGVYC